MSNISKCKSCGAEIVFIKSKSGGFIPCDAKTVPYWSGKEGKGKIVTFDGEVVSCELKGDYGKETGHGHMPHWATCNAPDMFRRR
jgi:hypothetical protein